MNIVCIGAHPDDCEAFAGGTSVKWARAGHRVTLVSMTNGDIGHQMEGGGALAQRRANEAAEAARIAGCRSLVLDTHDGELEVTLAQRKTVARLLRNLEADIVLTHRPWDYHPDHRYTALLVQDAAFMVTVPYFCPDTAPLARNPLFVFLMDHFKRPYPFQAEIAVAVDDVMDIKWEMLHVMESQVYEWLPWLEGLPGAPSDPAERRAWLKQHWSPWLEAFTELGRGALAKRYGQPHADKVAHAELFEICEYGRQPDEGEIEELFPL
ncbi:MAG: PIG-L deacetylase family protein [Candidatus Hydrogenedentota bacterium]